MYLYIIFFIIAICGFFDVLIEKDKRPNYYGVVFVCTVVLLFVLSAFRYERGADWMAYAAYYEHCYNWDFKGWMEPGFTVLCKVLALLSSDFSVLIFTMALIIYLIKPCVIYKLAPYPFVALLSWYAISLSDIFPTRQTVTTAIILYSTLFIIKRRFVPFVFCLVLASLFHLTSLIFIVAYFIYPIKISRFWAVIAFVSSFILAIGGSGIIESILGGISNPIIQERIEHYLEQGADNTFGQAYSTQQVLLRGFINRGIIIGLIFIFLDRQRREDAIFNGWVNMFLFSSVFFASLSCVNVALGRLVAYFDLSQVFIFAYIFNMRTDLINKMLIYGFLILYLLYRFYGVVNNYYDLYIPYKSLFWNYNMPVILY